MASYSEDDLITVLVHKRYVILQNAILIPVGAELCIESNRLVDMFSHYKLLARFG